jgi:hypothetical protein
MGLGQGIAAALQALARGAYDARAAEKLGPDFRSILDAQYAARDIATRKGRAEVEGEGINNEGRRQVALKAAVENAANMEPETAVVGMGEVGTEPRPETQDRTDYTAPAGLGVTDEQFGSMAKGARTERKSALAMVQAETRRQLAEQAFQDKRALLGEKHDFTMDELQQKGLSSRDIERLRQEGRVQIVGMQQGGQDRRNAANIQGRHEDVAAAVAGRGANAAAATSDRGLGGTIFDLQRDLRNEPDPELQNAIRARISALEADRERAAKKLRTPGPAPTSAVAAPAPASSPAPAAPKPVAVTSKAEVQALADGALFTLNGKTYRKQGNAAVPVQ